jgi:phosphoribosyl 1,2-cyclic phosphate phosphodiesterase
MIGCDCATCQSTDPRDQRLRPSIVLEADDGTALLVDAGPDLRAQALRHRIRHLDAIIFTHGHADHILGLDDVRRFNFVQQRSMPCYGDELTIADVRQTFAYAFDPRTQKGGGLPRLETFTIAGPFCLRRHEIVPVPVWHGRRPILGIRLGRVAYLTDCNRIPETSWPLLEGLDVLVIDALRHRPHPTHFSLTEAIEVSQRIGASRTYFTHMCHDLPHAATCAELPSGMELAYDGLVLEVEDAARDPRAASRGSLAI